MNNIEILEDYLKFIKQFDNNSDFIPALENLIQENKELKEQRDSLMWQRNTIDIPKIEELEQKLNFENEKNVILANNIEEQIKYGTKITLTGDAVPNVIEILKKDYISKSKVKEKIEEYDKMIKATYGDMTVSGKYRREVCLEIKQNLQELLGKGE